MFWFQCQIHPPTSIARIQHEHLGPWNVRSARIHPVPVPGKQSIFVRDQMHDLGTADPLFRRLERLFPPIANNRPLSGGHNRGECHKNC